MALKPPVSQNDHIQGNLHAEIELVEYGDYQCPHCGDAYPIVKSLQRQFGRNLKFIFRNFPLTEVHPQAKIAAVATEAAALQGKFWEMHDIIFENQRNLMRSSIMRYAAAVGLQLDQFESDLDNYKLVKKVEMDFESGLRSGVNGTPGFFVNGEKYNDSWDEGNFSNYLKRKIDFVV
jgi:protein-disulfide isomerase